MKFSFLIRPGFDRLISIVLFVIGNVSTRVELPTAAALS